MQEILIDSKNGKDVDWKSYKMKSLLLSDIYLRLGLKNKGYLVRECGSYLMFKEYIDGTKKLHKANFCKVRLCPMCSWRRSLKVFGQVSKVMDYITENYEYKYIFLTLTVKNVIGEDLSSELDKLFISFKALTKRKEFKSISKGWFRCLEVTHNWEENTYHPHFHMVIAVNKSYFTDNTIYLNHKNWVDLWRSCLGVNYDPFVNVQVVKKNSDSKDYKSAVAEVAKYAVKSADYILKVPDELKDIPEAVKQINDLTDNAVYTIDFALHSRRLIAFGGKFREVHKILSLDDSENGDLINTDNDDSVRDDLNYILVRYNWNIGFGNYIKFNSQ